MNQPTKTILVADSGSTHTQWALISSLNEACSTHWADSNSFPIIETPGLNPLTTSQKEGESILRELRSRLPEGIIPDEIHFYGAGCGHKQGKENICSMIVSAFPDAKISVEGDLLGACRALLGDQAGLVGILGTGSNACYYDGHQIAKQLTSMGYLLGDEGSGNHIGKLLLRCYLSDSLSMDLREDFNNQYQLSKSDLIYQLYHHPHPNRYLASFVPFVAKHQTHPFMQELLKRAFMEYLTHQVYRIADFARALEISMVGSVASVFQSELREAATAYGITISKILQEPIQALAHYHASRQF